jgi:hypothetical protein
MANIQFNYLYRDGANYKQFGFVIFKNISGISLEDATSKVRSKLISYEFFVPQDWGLPRLHFHTYDPEIDHEWHEFENWEVTNEPPTDPWDTLAFLNMIGKGLDL